MIAPNNYTDMLHALYSVYMFKTLVILTHTGDVKYVLGLN